MRRSLAAAVIAISLSSSAIASEYPAHAITFIVPFAAGGPTDTVARAIAGSRNKGVGQPIIIEKSRDRSTDTTRSCVNRAA
jgi:tripartite-type tricarboxylate transporter receptor subunit TctC